MKITMLIVEDDEGLRPSLEKSFSRKGYEVHGVSTMKAAVSFLKRRRIDLILLDLQLPDGSGLDVLAFERGLDKETPVIIITAFPDVKTAVNAMKKGASDFIIKPFELEELHLTVARALETVTLRRDVRRLKREQEQISGITEILGESPAIEHVRDLIRNVASTKAPVLVSGETGTGKELVADAIHSLSPRSSEPMVKVNCSAFSEQLLESELFGHEKGAFTDAKEARKGIFEMANGGTLLLDEISEMKLGLQAKLLRVIEGKSFRRVGGNRNIWIDVRIIATTNRDLATLIQSGTFREDMFFRLNTFKIDVPPLRSRGTDVILLAEHFLQTSASALRKAPIRLTSSVKETLVTYEWPGNVRELRNMMERAAILSQSDEVELAHLPKEARSSAFVNKQIYTGLEITPSLREIEQRYIAEVVQNVGGNLTEAARVLGISRNTLKSKYRRAQDKRQKP